MTAEKRIANLDGLRFIAAAVVAVCHFDLIKVHFGLERTGWRFFSNSAQVAVTFFFVLSGFLITWLLLREKLADVAGRISIRRFYGKRIRRIWPLYYLLLLLTFFVFREISLLHPSGGNEWAAGNNLVMKRFTGYLFFLPNYTEYTWGPQFYFGQTWSLGVEEFFYLFFPVGLYFVSKQGVLKYLVMLAAVFFLLSVGVHFFNRYSFVPGGVKSILFVFFDKYRIYAFAAGGIGAWLLLNRDSTITHRLVLLEKKPVARTLLFLLTGLVLGGITFSFLTQQVYSMLIAILIYATVSSGISFSLLNSRVMIYLGKISYGIYMLHGLGIIIVLQLAGNLEGLSMAGEILLAAAAVLLTILLATASYELFEKFFLRKKRVKPLTE